MGKRITMFLFVIPLLVLSSSVDVKAEARKTLSEVDRKLKLLNKPAIKSIKSEDGDIIDCVDIYKQPAFDHPALRNHKIQMRPSIIFPSDATSTKNESSPSVLFQTWQKSGSCPKGTIPIRRIRREELLRVASLKHFGRDGPRNSSVVNTTNDKSSRFVDYNGTKYAVFPLPDHSAAYLITTGYSYIGARADINVWSPRVESPDEHTTAQIWLKSGPGDNFESIEAGWMVNPAVFRDTQPRVFIRWTDPNAGRWWLQFQDEVIGYWPGEILSNLKQKAILVQWGGDVYSKKMKPGHPHTATGMGSGDYASGLWGGACYIKNVRILDYSLQLKYPEWVTTAAEEPYCYNSLNYQRSLAMEPIFYFGGPGRNPNCP
ncbi:AslB [Fagus crenata]